MQVRDAFDINSSDDICHMLNRIRRSKKYDRSEMLGLNEIAHNVLFHGKGGKIVLGENIMRISQKEEGIDEFVNQISITQSNKGAPLNFGIYNILLSWTVARIDRLNRSIVFKRKLMSASV